MATQADAPPGPTALLRAVCLRLPESYCAVAPKRLVELVDRPAS